MERGTDTTAASPSRVCFVQPRQRQPLVPELPPAFHRPLPHLLPPCQLSPLLAGPGCQDRHQLLPLPQASLVLLLRVPGHSGTHRPRLAAQQTAGSDWSPGQCLVACHSLGSLQRWSLGCGQRKSQRFHPERLPRGRHCLLGRASERQNHVKCNVSFSNSYSNSNFIVEDYYEQTGTHKICKMYLQLYCGTLL